MVNTSKQKVPLDIKNAQKKHGIKEYVISKQTVSLIRTVSGREFQTGGVENW